MVIYDLISQPRRIDSLPVLSVELLNNAKLAILGHYFFEVNKRTIASYQNPKGPLIQRM
tara:strand:+ start:152511 stop:152687 length:177 start_codon:yes stop_codon:yes gene_type:complete